MGGDVGHLPGLQQRPDVLARTADEPGEFSARPDVFEGGKGVTAVEGEAVGVGGVGDVVEVVGAEGAGLGVGLAVPMSMRR